MRLFSIAALLALCVLSCSGDGDDESTSNGGDECDAAPTFSQVTAFSEVCVNCHSSTLDGNDRNGAPAGYDFDEYASASDKAGEIEDLVQSGEMPPAYAGYTLSEAQQSALYLWIDCGTPR
jgi:mono/diheme cytochrome c family protein